MPNNFQPPPPRFTKGERLTAAKLNELAESVARLLWQKQQASNATFGVRQPLNITGKLNADLEAATAFADDPATAAMSIWIKDIETGDMVDSGRDVTIVNRMEGAGPYDSGTVVQAEWIDGEWRLYAADC